jgi:WD40 repeat protein
VAVADLDGDGVLDLAVANGGSNNVSVLLGNGDGTFQAAANYAVGSDPVAIAAGNFDGNGYLDLSVANKGDNTLSRLYNYGDGQFFAGETYSAVSDPVSIATGDFNHDGLTDEAIALSDPKVAIEIGFLNRDAVFNTSIGVSYSPDGKEVAMAVRTADEKHYAVKVWNPSTGERIGVITVNDAITAIAYSRDTVNKDIWLAIAVGARGKPKEVEIMDMTNKQPKFLMELDIPDGDIPRSVAFSSTDVNLAVGTQGGYMDVWKLDTGTWEYEHLKDKEIGPKHNPVTEVFFAQGPILVGLSADVIVYWNLPNKSASWQDAQGSDVYTYAAISPGQTTIRIGFRTGKTVRLDWNGGVPQNGEANFQPQTPFPIPPVESIVYLNDGTYLQADAEVIHRWSGFKTVAADGPLKTPAIGMALSPDQSIVAVALSNGTVQLYNTKDLSKGALLK